jgi:hypothetical protein
MSNLGEHIRRSFVLIISIIGATAGLVTIIEYFFPNSPKPAPVSPTLLFHTRSTKPLKPPELLGTWICVAPFGLDTKVVKFNSDGTFEQDEAGQTTFGKYSYDEPTQELSLMYAHPAREGQHSDIEEERGRVRLINEGKFELEILKSKTYRIGVALVFRR